ncbi:uncharacterized protein K452DRAFT_114903 [Aplosporella prunicola CBS 121167]|uniref:Uncharacterized protein n=1 Tax=Aplosporella prunicola CBS 121167 TaxID=1176127 RepID=A0A6A6B0E1_9PEZI|nr:uncharacterized protein K452DRAFT_114903 [Aplosporella prunicola CBS 121167]KAF2137018.1 hypothetical protein K452DRAFT_114903 [Aplosporella prunicola CBS 121167]
MDDGYPHWVGRLAFPATTTTTTTTTETRPPPTTASRRGPPLLHAALHCTLHAACTILLQSCGRRSAYLHNYIQVDPSWVCLHARPSGRPITLTHPIL